MRVERPFGLITESHYDRRELYGFEVDLNGLIVVPEFHPRPVPTGALPALMSFTSEYLAAGEETAQFPQKLAHH